MEIDWFTVGAQLVNFGILFALLSKFLYRPIVDAVDRREAKIAARLEEAERREEEAERAKRHYEELEAEFEQKREERMEAVRREAAEKRREMLDEVRREVQEAREQWFGRLRSEQKRFLGEFSNRLESELFGMTRDALEDLADVSVANRIVERFLERLESSDGEVRAEVARERDEGAETVHVRSSFELGANQRRRIEAFLEEMFDGTAEVRFEVDDALVAGIELRVGARRFGWNIRAYLDSLRGEMQEVLSAGHDRLG